MPEREDPSMCDNATLPPSAPSDEKAESAGERVPESERKLPQSIGTYRILSVIGRGGMGVVYRAEQANPKRNVALKVIGSSFITPELLRRFELEALTLGRLRHPGIAQIYEAGTAADGFGGVQAFFAMELIEGGLPLDAYVAQAKLDVPGRLRLLCAICDAVQHAHQQGVIHRDLKPDNVLVTLAGEPKIVDFGIARVTDSDVRAPTLQTNVGQIIGTLPYMSPEQAGGDPSDVDTRADIYALGVIGYELLAGRLPLDLRHHLISEAIRVIREKEPERLSSINRTFRGDVETIIGKALAKEKERRYASASDLAADVRHYLSDEPIAARPPSVRYQVTKFALRNRALMAGSAATLLVLVASVVASTNFAIREARQRAEADRQRAAAVVARGEAEKRRAEAEQREHERSAVADFVSNDVFARATPEAIPNAAVRDTIVHILLDPAAQTARTKFVDQPAIAGAVLASVGKALLSLGRAAEADVILREARGLMGMVYNQDEPNSIAVDAYHAETLREIGHFPESDALFQSVVERSGRITGQDSLGTIAVRANYAKLLDNMGRTAEASQLREGEVERSRRLFGTDDPATIEAIADQAAGFQAQGNTAAAEPLLAQVLENRRRTLGTSHPDTIKAMTNYALALQTAGHREEAETLAAEAEKGARSVLGEDHPVTLTAINNHAGMLAGLKRNIEAEPLLHEAYQRQLKLLGPDHTDTCNSEANWASTLSAIGRLAEAEPIARDVDERGRHVLGAAHPLAILWTRNHARILEKLGRVAEAEPIYRDAVERAAQSSALGITNERTLLFARNDADCLDSLGKHDEAASVRSRFRLPTTAPTTNSAFLPATKPN